MGRAALHALSRLGHHVAPTAQHGEQASGKFEGGSVATASVEQVSAGGGINIEQAIVSSKEAHSLVEVLDGYNLFDVYCLACFLPG